MNFGIPWNEIKARWESNETAYYIEQDFNRKGQKITRQGIEARAKRDGWVRRADGGLMAVAENSPVVQPANGRNLDKRSPERIAAILETISQGSPAYLAAESNGIDRGTWSRWCKEDYALAEQAQSARLSNLAMQVNVIHKAGQRGDWKASHTLLKAAPETKDYFAEDQKPPAIQFVLNITRDNIAPETIVSTQTNTAGALESLPT